MKPELKKLVEQLEKIKSIDELQAWKKDHELSKDLLKGALARSQDLLTISPKEALQLSEWALSVAFDLEDPWLEASALRANHAYRDVPIVLTSADTDPELARRATECGARALVRRRAGAQRRIGQGVIGGLIH